jgi:hypothetical protein
LHKHRLQPSLPGLDIHAFSGEKLEHKRKANLFSFLFKYIFYSMGKKGRKNKIVPAGSCRHIFA